MTEPAVPLWDPEFLPYRIDPVLRRVLWLRMPREVREGAAFLDERAMPASPEGAWAPFASLDAIPMPPRSAHAIFHIGHCGSTLLSRVLESTSAVQGLREPLPLRTLADAWPTLGHATARLSPAQATTVLAGVWRACSRPVAVPAQVVVKATSRCTPLIDPLLETFPDLRVVLLDMPLRPWLATLFKSEGSIVDAASAAGERLAWLQGRGLAAGRQLHGLDLPAQCALGWLAEQLRFGALASGSAGERVLRVDFESLLDDPRGTLGRICTHLRLDPSVPGAAIASPHWGRYSKATEHAYRAEDRRHDITLALSRFRAEVDAGTAAVSDALKGHEVAARIVVPRLG